MDRKDSKRYSRNTDLDRKVIGAEIARGRSSKWYGSGRNGSYTQKDLCRDLKETLGVEIDVRTLSRIESGKQEPTLSLFVQIAWVIEGDNWDLFVKNTIRKALSKEMKGSAEHTESVKRLFESLLEKHSEDALTEREEAIISAIISNGTRPFPPKSGGYSIDREEKGEETE